MVEVKYKRKEQQKGAKASGFRDFLHVVIFSLVGNVSILDSRPNFKNVAVYFGCCLRKIKIRRLMRLKPSDRAQWVNDAKTVALAKGDRWLDLFTIRRRP
jgi:hypothetical protein